ncbi:uncharacterized protein FA14DRAFT_154928 [Meira miltonrushii]|uniref:Uncharacterized protein n=1 Tax=Meira miltonrushii TaxID=1280837 RepID=A0A316VJ38_9BASI|nr:uncharacterized protein FA14DRAFT_154928 [Meira miltonrushii]PWN35515.1 hypothetical protein FA14DRAFT_154928 [Meira miltonrushii]
MKICFYTFLLSILYVIVAISNVLCSSGKGKEVAESSSAASTPRKIPFAKGNKNYHLAKLHKHTELREIAATSADLQDPNHYVDMSKKESKRRFDKVHSMVPVVNYFRGKTGKHIATLENLSSGQQLPGKKDLEYLRKKGKLSADHELPPP